MIRLLIRFTTYILAVIGLVAVIPHVLSAVRHETRPDALSVEVSPDGRFKVLNASWFGGGGISPYCQSRVTVVPAGFPNDVPSEDQAVFSGECGSFAPHAGHVENSPIINWEGRNTLHTRFSVLATALSSAAFHLRKQDATGQVAIHFEVGE